MSDDTETTAVAVVTPKALTPARTMRQFLDRHIAAIGSLLPKGDDPSRYVAATAMAIAQNPKIAECDPVSVLLSVQRIAQWGLEIGVTAYLVPRWNSRQGKNICQPQTHYRGEIELMLAARAARSIRAHAVYEGEVWEYEEGLSPVLRHVPDGAKRKNPQQIVRTYAIAQHGAGVPPTIVVCERHEIDRRRKIGEGAKKGDGPSVWDTHFEAMAIKCAIRMLSSQMPKNARLVALYDTIDRWDEVVEQSAGQFGANTLAAPTPMAALAAGDDDAESVA